MPHRLGFILLSFIFSCSDKPVVKMIEYFDNGQVRSEIEYLDSVKNGCARFYYESGVLKEKYMYVNDTVEGDYIIYDETGLTSSKAYFWKGNPVGPIFYYENGNLRLYNERDYNGEVYYVQKFSATGEKVKEEGVCISPNVKVDTMPQSIELFFFYSEPVGYSNQLQVFLNDDLIKIDTLNGHIGVVRLPRADSSKIKILSSLTSPSGRVICSDSIVRHIN